MFFPRPTLYLARVLAVVVCLYVRLSVCLSHVGVLLKGLNVGLRMQCLTIAQGVYSLQMPKISEKLKRNNPQQRRQMRVG